MASACVNNVSVSPERFTATKYRQRGWLSPRVSFGRNLADEEGKASSKQKAQSLPHPPSFAAAPKAEEDPDLDTSAGDFEFLLEDPVGMLPADELFSDGKLVPLHLSSLKPMGGGLASIEIGSPGAEKSGRIGEISNADPYIFSPKAPRCSSRWRELLGLKKLYQSSNSNMKNSEPLKTSSSAPSSSSSLNAKSLKNFLHRSSKSTISDAYLSLPLLKDSDSESVSISSSRLSLSSSSSGHEHDDLPRLSLDSDKTAPNPFKGPSQNPPRMRLVKPTTTTNSTRMGRSPMRRTVDPPAMASRGVSVDSPRMNSSGKIVFQSLERSSSSPSTFNGGPRYKNRGMERSYSTNVRVTPVLNVPVSSLSKPGSVFGFGQLFSSPQKRDSTTTTTTNGGPRTHHHHHNYLHQQQNSNSSRNRT